MIHWFHHYIGSFVSTHCICRSLPDTGKTFSPHPAYCICWLHDFLLLDWYVDTTSMLLILG